MTDPRDFTAVSHAADSWPDALPAARRGHPAISAFSFYLACGVSGAFAAVVVAVLFHETIGEPIGLLLACSGTAGVLTSLLLYHVAKQRFCDRAIVMGGGLVSAVMCSMMFLD